MYLVHIYNSFIFNLFLTFLTFIYVSIKTFVLGHLCWRIEELYMSGIFNFLDMLKSQMRRNNRFGESLLADLIHAAFIYAVFLDLMQVPRCSFCLAAIVFQVNTTNSISIFEYF